MNSLVRVVPSGRGRVIWHFWLWVTRREGSRGVRVVCHYRSVVVFGVGVFGVPRMVAPMYGNLAHIP